MRLLLDAHFPAKRIAVPLRADGHDVLALAEAPELDGLTDQQVLELASEQRRIVITRNAKDFAPLLRVWAEAGRHHAGCILVWSLPHDRFGAILRAVRAQLATRPRPRDWQDLSVGV
ncbi:MAG: DUF5615 family PIN-like protein [Planctomycetaceae bacterium]